MKIVVLLSIGSHPASLRACRADLDARALQLALPLPWTQLIGLHAGDPDNSALRDYLGQGCPNLTVIALDNEQDALDPVSDYLTAEKPDIVLCGMAAERGEGSGMLPYLLAERLGATLLPGIAEITDTDQPDRIVARQALPGGQRRQVAAPLPCILTIAASASPPGPVIHRAAATGRVDVLTKAVTSTPHRAGDWTFSPAAKRPKRLAQGTGPSAGGLGAIMSGGGGDGGTLLDNHSAEEIADALLDRLKALKVVTSDLNKK